MMDDARDTTENDLTEKQINRKTIKSFIGFAAAIVLAVAGWIWLNKQPEDQGALLPLRKAMDANEKIFSSINSETNLAPTYPLEKAEKNVRVNGLYGLKGDSIIEEDWRLQIIRNSGDTLYLTMDELKSFPKTEIVFDFKCIEGWNQITHWGGVKFSEVASRYQLGYKNGQDFKSNPAASYKYAGMQTPDKKYYVGIDMQSMMHPQTLLCYEMNDKPLPNNQGYPLRLIIPVKYGIKSIKRIGTLHFSDTRPPDYWAERGYDYYSGL